MTLGQEGGAPPATVTAAAVKAMLRDGAELAFLDVREEGEFALGHPLFASPLPLGQIEMRVAGLLPRRDVRVVLMDAGDGRAERAALRLSELGYRDVRLLEGGLEGWRNAGYEVFTGVHVPSKAFGEVVEHQAGTPRIEARDLRALVSQGRDLVILDSRPMAEFRVMSIPGAVNVPGGELVHRIKDLAPRPDTLVVVNCAGRTRSIIGAQSLINAGVENPVMALKNGTMGWHLAGLALDHGKTAGFGPISPEAAAWSRDAAGQLVKRLGVSVIGGDELARFAADATRTLFRFDVRDPAEYAAGHPKDFRSAPGGQLVQATDSFAGVRQARLVLFDDFGTRAIMAAHWLLQMGWRDVHVLQEVPPGTAFVTGPEQPEVLGLEAADPPLISPAELADLLKAGGPVVIDLDTSLAYRAGHIPGAWWAVRSRFPRSLPKVPDGAPPVLTSRDGLLARLAAEEAAALLNRPVVVLEGGTAAWKAAGLPVATGLEHMADEPTDIWYKPYDHAENVEAAMYEYLRWEVDLTRQIEADGDASFEVLRG